MKTRQFAVMWDCNGIEAITEIPDPKLRTFAVLSNTQPPMYPNILHWQLRAQINSHRHYEIYIFSTAFDISSEAIRLLFESNPQGMADLVRKRGQCLFSARQKQNIKIW